MNGRPGFIGLQVYTDQPARESVLVVIEAATSVVVVAAAAVVVVVVDALKGDEF